VVVRVRSVLSLLLLVCGCRLIAGIDPVELAAVSTSEAGTTADVGVIPNDAPSTPLDAGMDAARVRVSNYDNNTVCDLSSSVAPRGPNERGDWAASRMVPDRYPFVVESLEYELATSTNELECDTSVMHQVIVFRGTTARPAEVPVPYLEFTTAPLAVPKDGPRIVTHVLPLDPQGKDQLVLQNGEFVFVAVQFPHLGTRYGCTPFCADLADASIPDRNWWWAKSRDGGGPDTRPVLAGDAGVFVWRTLRSYSAQFGTLRFSVYGRYL
jgi:hypothetical protein